MCVTVKFLPFFGVQPTFSLHARKVSAVFLFLAGVWLAGFWSGCVR
ncbi:hypothetical protein GVAMD_0594 [Gardnerella vaginalis AMD]|nr:hypothetical protein GVAMD_0594 [Gardnerella vaginalis AMD]